MGDYIGRKPVFFISLIILIIGKIMQLFLTSWYYLYMLGNLISALTPMAMYQTVLIIGMEISSIDDNPHIAMLQGIGWTLGISILPLLYWWLQNWFYFVLISSLPITFFMINNKYMIESPRWLSSRGKVERCEKMLRKIAKVNKTTLNDDALEILKQDKFEQEKLYGMASLFSSFTLAKNSLMMALLWIIGGLAHFMLILNVTNMDGNPFLNFLYQGIVELPALFLGKWTTNKFGRKWTAVGSFTCATISAVPLLFTSVDSSLHVYTTTLTVIIRFCISVTFFVMMIQGVEIFPTCLRQTGVALGVILGNAFGILGPYVVYLGTAYDVRYPYLILVLLMLSGFFAEMMLPETLHHKLPETLAEAQNFGRDQKFWHLPKKPAAQLEQSLRLEKK
uniref:Putative synaptic vesicle transporter svop n=1 Tax=Xenopsylla cheopis TaxID=163159 RepID=A0A6M2DYH2_XENCH